jgi:hypothetical protein
MTSCSFSTESSDIVKVLSDFVGFRCDCDGLHRNANCLLATWRLCKNAQFGIIIIISTFVLLCFFL